MIPPLSKNRFTNMVERTRKFFGGAKQCVVLLTAVVFALAWLRQAKPHYGLAKSYEVVPFDVFEQRSVIAGMRTQFRTLDVACSFMTQYKKSYPMYNFALVSGKCVDGRQTIYRYV